MFVQLEDYMLPCLSKRLFGFECLGCGMQRSLLFISKGEFIEAFKMYPAIYTILLFFTLVMYNFIFKKKKVNSKIIYSLAILNIIIILISYFYKIY
ncbi:MAG: DUF2752 domain-containing protein [Polaribacter sp.]|jgi:hypothetical protein|nr:DUF2752 domain-containing protein [Polaribacter sp.]MDG1954218.1 DUF2752 domain-containing protein [Polaribacter sp.]MDG2073777.1 DUF2752 domain-containing protein [Polaribacter sp.]